MPYAIYHGAYKSDITGDRHKAATYSRFIRTKFAFLDSQRRISNAPYISRTWKMSDGATISLTINSGQFHAVVYVPYIQKRPDEREIQRCLAGILAIPSASSAPDGWGRPLEGPFAVDQLGTPGGPDPQTLYYVDTAVKAVTSYHPYANPYEKLPASQQPPDIANFYTSYKISMGEFLTIPLHCAGVNYGEVPNRYNSVGVSQIIYACGEVYASHPTNIIEGCLTYKDTSTDVTYLYVLTTNGTRNVCTIWRRPKGKRSVAQDTLYDAATNPKGWQEVFAYTNPPLDPSSLDPADFPNYQGASHLKIHEPLASIGAAAGSSTTGQFAFVIGIKSKISVSYPGNVGDSVTPLGYVLVDVSTKSATFTGILALTYNEPTGSIDENVGDWAFAKTLIAKDTKDCAAIPAPPYRELRQYTTIKTQTSSNFRIKNIPYTDSVVVAVDFITNDLITLLAADSGGRRTIDTNSVEAYDGERFETDYCDGAQHVSAGWFFPYTVPGSTSTNYVITPRETTLTQYNVAKDKVIGTPTTVLKYAGEIEVEYTYPFGGAVGTFYFSDDMEHSYILALDLKSTKPMTYVSIRFTRDRVHEDDAANAPRVTALSLSIEGAEVHTSSYSLPYNTYPWDYTTLYLLLGVNLPIFSVGELFFPQGAAISRDVLNDHYGNAFLSVSKDTLSSQFAPPVLRGFNTNSGVYIAPWNATYFPTPAPDGRIQYYSPNKNPFPLLMNSATYGTDRKYTDLQLI